MPLFRVHVETKKTGTLQYEGTVRVTAEEGGGTNEFHFKVVAKAEARVAFADGNPPVVSMLAVRQAETEVVKLNMEDRAAMRELPADVSTLCSFLVVMINQGILSVGKKGMFLRAVRNTEVLHAEATESTSTVDIDIFVRPEELALEQRMRDVLSFNG